MNDRQDPAAPARAASSRGLRAALLALVCAAWALAGPAHLGAAEGGLQAQLRDLAAAEGLSVAGLDRLGAAPAADLPADPDPLPRLEALLRGYSYVILHSADGRIAGVRILGVGRAGPPRIKEVSVPARRRGVHHLVEAALAGPTGLWLSRQLMLDTGASTVVLPASAIPGLGFRPRDLTDGMVETAGGKVPAKSGRLASITIGQAVVRDVAVTFVADDKIGEAALLGMSFLDRFQVTIDDAASRIILVAKEPAPRPAASPPRR